MLELFMLGVNFLVFDIVVGIEVVFCIDALVKLKLIDLIVDLLREGLRWIIVLIEFKDIFWGKVDSVVCILILLVKFDMDIFIKLLVVFCEGFFLEGSDFILFLVLLMILNVVLSLTVFVESLVIDWGDNFKFILVLFEDFILLLFVLEYKLFKMEFKEFIFFLNVFFSFGGVGISFK